MHKASSAKWYGKPGNGKERALAVARIYRITHPLYLIWIGIKRRLYDPKTPCFRHYGGRGIAMHPHWRISYPHFEEWIVENIGPRPSQKHSLDRIDPDGHYAPGNLRWADGSMQRMNTREAVAFRTLPILNSRILALEALVDSALSA